MKKLIRIAGIENEDHFATPVGLNTAVSEIKGCAGIASVFQY